MGIFFNLSLLIFPYNYMSLEVTAARVALKLQQQLITYFDLTFLCCRRLCTITSPYLRQMSW